MMSEPITPQAVASEAWNALFDADDVVGDNRSGMQYVILRSMSDQQNGGIVQSWFEVDEEGFVHRHFEVGICGPVDPEPKFTPEDVLHAAEVQIGHMRGHPDARFISEDHFEYYWHGFRDRRSFIERVPNRYKPAYGQYGEDFVCWIPNGYKATSLAGGDWVIVPGFERLLVQLRDDNAPERIVRAIFLGRKIEWWNEDGEPLGES